MYERIALHSAARGEPPPCETEASCKPAPTPQPTLYSAPASATFNGPGNIAPRSSPPPVKKVVKKIVKCKRGFTKGKQDKCVKKKAKKAKRSSHDRKASR